MRLPIARVGVVLAVSATLIALSSPLALASSGPRMYSADQVGYGFRLHRNTPLRPGRLPYRCSCGAGTAWLT
jgi:hypothetical protein